MLATVLLLWGCSEMETIPTAKTPAKPKDGELTYPADYKTWPKFLSEVQRPDAKQIRELFVNQVGARTNQGQMFPNGTVMVMELYKAKLNGDVPEAGADGRLVKGDLAKVFVMGKGEGWGQDVPDNLKNGNWAFPVFGPDGKALADDFTKCRACHAPLAAKDFVHRYDEYFDKRMARWPGDGVGS
jgi:hemoglobin